MNFPYRQGRTLPSLINVYTRLFIQPQFSTIHDLIRDYTFINFWQIKVQLGIMATIYWKRSKEQGCFDQHDRISYLNKKLLKKNVWLYSNLPTFRWCFLKHANFSQITLVFPLYTFISPYTFITLEGIFHHTCLFAPTHLLGTGE